MTFFRQAALLLPSSFLLGVLLFLLTHGPADAGFGVYPFFEEWLGGALVASGARVRFLEQALLFFLPLYLVTLLFILCVALAETALFGPRGLRGGALPGGAFARAFGPVYLLVTAVMVFLGDRAVTRWAPGALLAPLLVAVVPFLAAPVAVLPAGVAGLFLALVRRSRRFV